MDNKKDDIVNQVVSEASQRVAEKDAAEENVQYVFQDGKVFLSASGLITMLMLNSKKKALNNREKEIFERVITVLRTYERKGLDQMANDLNFFPGEEITYIGGQLAGEVPALELNKGYHCYDTCLGKFGNEMLPVVRIEELEGATPDLRPAFKTHMFRKTKHITKVISMNSEPAK